MKHTSQNARSEKMAQRAPNQTKTTHTKEKIV